MGYSCTQAASQMLGLIRHSFGDGVTSNGLAIGGKTYFYEIGRENADGRITGTLFLNVSHEGFPGQEYARKFGTFCIHPTGVIVRFPRIKSGQRVALKFRFDELQRSNPSLLNSYSHGVI